MNTRFALFSTSCTHYHNGVLVFYSCPGCISSGRVNLGHFLAVQMCFILHRFYIPPPSLSLMFLWAVKNGLALQELSQKSSTGKRWSSCLSDRLGCQLWKYNSSSQLEWNTFALGDESSFTLFDADLIGVKEAVEDTILVFKLLSTLIGMALIRVAQAIMHFYVKCWVFLI